MRGLENPLDLDDRPDPDMNWRDEVATYLRGVFVVGLLLVAITVVGAVWSGAGSWSLVFMLAVQVASTAALLAVRQRPIATAVVSLVGLFAVHFATLAHFGPVQGAGMLVALILVVGAVYFDSRVNVLLLAIVLLGGMGIGFMRVEAGDVPVLDPGRPETWVRTSIITATMGAFLLAALGVIVRTFERALAQARAAQRAEAEARQQHERVSAALGRARELEAMGRLAGGVAHDFNNALTILLAHSDDLLHRDLPPDVRERVAAIDQAAQAAAATTHQLLVFARGGDRQGTCDPAATLRDGLKNLIRLLPEDVRLKLDVSGSEQIGLSAADLLQVVINLVLNARDACPNGGTIAVRSRPEGRRVLVEVEDDGAGMDDATRARLFEPFFTTKGERGTGLGMAMVQGTVVRAGGSVDVDSAPGKGTRIRLRFPIVSAEAARPARAPERMTLVGTTAMVVEDDLEIQEIARQCLRAAGAEVLAAASVEEALKALEGARIVHVLCTDGVLSDGTALPVIETFRRRFPDAPILLCSGHVPDELEARGLLPSRRDRLQKPFTGSQLVRAVSGLLARA